MKNTQPLSSILGRYYVSNERVLLNIRTVQITKLGRKLKGPRTPSRNSQLDDFFPMAS
jgi:hypothetical protein